MSVIRTDATLPMSVEDITARWMSEALEREVDAVAVDEVIWGTATKVLVKVGFADGSETALCVKGGFTPELMERMAIAYQCEARFYGELGPHLDAGVPECHFAAIDEASGQGLVILADLRDECTTFGDPRSPLSPDQVAAALEGQAHWHAGDPDAHVTWLPRTPHLRPVIEGLLNADNWNAQLETEKAAGLSADLRDLDRYRHATRTTWALDDAEPGRLCHGDANVTNLVITAGTQPWFLDWQFVCASHWAHDVTLFLVGAMDVEDRRAHERALIDHYAQARTALGDALDADAAFEAYRLHMLHGLLYAFIPQEMQPVEVCKAFADRYAAAAVDHQTLALLEAIGGRATSRSRR